MKKGKEGASEREKDEGPLVGITKVEAREEEGTLVGTTKKKDVRCVKGIRSTRWTSSWRSRAFQTE